MRQLFVMDPIERIDVGGDSTFMLMREATDRGFEVAWCTPGDLFAITERAYARAEWVRTTRDAPHFHRQGREELPLDAFDVVWMRKDPPFDMHYIFATYLLDFVRGQAKVVNDPVGLKRFNEKLWAMQFPQHHPTTLLSRDAKKIRAFVRDQPGRVVIKPWDGNGGRGVLVTHGEDRNLGSIIDLLTEDGRAYALVQPFLDKVVEGDKRILLFDGDPVAAMLRVPAPDDWRGNMHVGASVLAADLDARDRAICDDLGPHLREHGQVFVGIDVIDGKLTEINVTSPTGIQELNRLHGLDLEADLMDRVVS